MKKHAYKKERGKQYETYETRYFEAKFNLKGRHEEIRDEKFYRSRLRRLNAEYRHALRDMRNKIETLERNQVEYTENLFPRYVSLCEEIQDAKAQAQDLKFLKKFVEKNKREKKAKRLLKTASKRLKKTQLRNKEIQEELKQIKATVDRQDHLNSKTQQEVEALLSERDKTIEKRMVTDRAKVRYKIVVQNKTI